MRASTRKTTRPARIDLAGIGEGVLTPALRRFFDAMASHFPGHVMQRLMRADGSVRYTYVSPGVSALGLDPGEVLTPETSPQDWLHPDDTARWRAALATSAAMVATLDEEVRVIGKDGQVRWVRSIGNPRRLENGDTVWDGIALDVTDKREAMEALRLAKAQADAAEAQKAKLLEALRAVLDEPVADLGAARKRLPDGQELQALINRVADGLDHAVGLLNHSVAVQPMPPVRDGKLDALTQRQQDVLALLGEGKSNQHIADQLGIARGTVKLHVVAVLRTLGLSNRAQAAAFAARR